MTPDEALDKIEEILEEMMPEVRENPRAEEFAEGVEERLEDMRDWIIERSRVTEGQVTAIENVERGVLAWIKGPPR